MNRTNETFALFPTTVNSFLLNIEFISLHSSVNVLHHSSIIIITIIIIYYKFNLFKKLKKKMMISKRTGVKERERNLVT